MLKQTTMAAQRDDPDGTLLVPLGTNHSTENKNKNKNENEYGDDDDRIALYLKRMPFCAVWWFTLLCHCACAAFLCSSTALYVFLGDIDMIYYNKLLGSTLRYEMGTLGYVFVGMAALHFIEIARMVYYSVRARKLTFNAITTAAQRRTPVVTPSVPVSARPIGATDSVAPRKQNVRTRVRLLVPRRVLTFTRRLVRFLTHCKTKLLDRKHGLLGLESPYFNFLFLLRETVEIASQSYQMYKCSRLISSAWINNLFLIITVLNCWSTPILQHALARFNALERVICLTLDSFLDAGTCMLIPLIISVKYIQAFDSTLLAFPIENLTDPLWFTALILENRMLFAMNKTDLVTSLMPHYSLFGCMRKVKKLIQRLPEELENQELEVVYVNSMRVLVPKKAVRSPSPSAANTNKTHPTTSTQLETTTPPSPLLVEGLLKQKRGEMPGWKRRCVHVFFIGWGATVIGVHTRARQVSLRYSDIVACKQPLRPWFADAFMCASYQFDCAEQSESAGTLRDADLSVMDATTLSSMVISNCHALAMPDAIANLTGLLKFMVYNSTIVSWPASASLNANAHALLLSICVVACNMSHFPEGLQQQQPDSLEDVQFALTNLTSLPASLAKQWRVSKIFFEYCAFAEFPAVLSNLRVTEISFAGSKFTTMPDTLASMATSYEALVLGNSSQLTTLPEGSLPSGLETLSIEMTGVTTLPQPSSTSAAATATPATTTATATPPATTTATTSAPTGVEMPPPGVFFQSSQLTVYAHGTPLCDAMGGVSEADVGTTSSSTNSSTSTTTTVVVYCSTRDPNGVARFPLAWTIARFAPVQ